MEPTAELERGVAGGDKPAEHLPAGAVNVPATPHGQAVGAVPTVAEIPDPYDQPEAAGELSAKERDDLAVCEGALDVLRVAFWRAGKALKVISAARLYRETHSTFEEYVSDRWQMPRQHAYRLMDSAAIAEPIVATPLGSKINERQARELLPVSKHHSAQAAADLYLALAQEVAKANGNGPKVTAGLVNQAAGAALAELPPGSQWNRDTATEAVRAVLAQLSGQAAAEEPATDADPHSWFESERGRVATLTEKVAKRADRHPEEAKAFAEALRQYAKRIDKALTSSK
ncbi:hypothetical protein [Nocardia brasiliensis]|uniref:hypothetical protein n=1 Tax=Nocardia brasiliensis TaxID=37326 RepID=UPI002455ACE3|nr:hypothetical protein [Nocardia brasiliensis]